MNNEINYVSPFTRFCISIGNLPTAYLESMSYYESLTYLVNYLANNVIPALNNNGEVVEEVQAKFVELKNYVDTYFDNLDVQEEINNKLDEMVEDGTLQEIISDYLNSKAIFGFDNVQSMKESTNLIDGSYAKTLGYYSKNDGGAALYKIRTITNDDVVDESFIIELQDDSLIAELIYNSPINICQLGGQQNLGSICNRVIGIMGKSVYIPEGNYNLTETIHINNVYTKLICDGNINVTTENIAAICLRSNRCILQINGSINNENGIGIEICGGNHNAFDNDIFVNTIIAKTGILVDPDNGKGFQTSKLSFNVINASEIGINITPQNNGNPWVSTFTVNGGHIHSPYGVRINKGANQTDIFSQIVFNDITFSDNIQRAIDIQQCQDIWFNRCRMVEGMIGDTWIKIDNCSFVYIDSVGYIPVNKISIINVGSNYPCFINANMLTNSSESSIATKAKTFKDKIIMLEDPVNKNDLYITSYNTSSFNVPEYYSNNMIVQVGSDSENEALIYDLPEIFSQWGVTEFYLYLKNKTSNSSLIVRDYVHNKLIDLPTGQALSNKRWHVKYIKYIEGNPQWIVTPLNL